jgi:hypothetical protein
LVLLLHKLRDRTFYLVSIQHPSLYTTSIANSETLL